MTSERRSVTEALPPTAAALAAGTPTDAGKAKQQQQQQRTKLTKKDLFAKHMGIDPTRVGLIPVSPTNIYLDRLKGWAELIKRLISYFENTLAEEKRVSASLGQSVKSFATPILLRNEPVFESDETFQRFIKDIIETQNRRASEHSAAASSIEAETLPNLRDLLKEVLDKAMDTNREWTDLDKLLASNRETYVKLTKNLRLSIERQRILLGGDPDSPLNKAKLANIGKDIPRDPWQANLAIQRFIYTLRESFPKTLESLVNQQSRMLVFEKVVIQLLKPTLTSYFSRRSNKSSDALSSLLQSLDNLDPDKDWELFLARNKAVLVEPDAIEKGFAAAVVAKEVKYEGQEHSRCGFVKEGTLQRNIPGILRSKGYKAGHYVLTVSGFLHGFSEEKKETVVEVGSRVDAGHFALGEPDFSVYLPESIITLGEGKEGKEFSIKGSGGLFGSDKLTVKAKSDDNTVFWHDLITSLAVTPAPINEPSPRSSFSSEGASPLSPTTNPTLTNSETNLMFESGEEYTEFATGSSSEQLELQSSQPNMYEEEEESEDDMHPSIANALRGRAPPADLLALRASMTGASTPDLAATTSTAAPPPVMDAWANFKQQPTDLGNGWDDVNPTWG
ncbi:hypothetical protein HDU77_001351 [Chytriomyces hyalinus]|nr:hypothetical protein HDU77_001351 [Chytriomyces hyalinus]